MSSEDISSFAVTISPELERLVAEMEWEDISSTLDEVFSRILGAAPTPQPPPTPAPTPAGSQLCTPQPAGFSPQAAAPVIYSGFSPQGAAPVIYSAAPNQPAGFSPQGAAPVIYSAAPNQPAGFSPQRTALVIYSAAPNQPAVVLTQRQGLVNNFPLFNFPGCINQNPQLVGYLNGRPLYQLPPGFLIPRAPVVVPAPVKPNKQTNKPKKIKRKACDDQPYIKKPSNAFMLFMKEHRKSLAAQFPKQGAVPVNTAMGQLWRSLPQEEQAKYYEQADKERQAHAELYPNWSTKENYGVQRKRVKTKANTSAPGESSLVSRHAQ